MSLTSSGIKVKSFAEIFESVEQDVLANVNANAVLTPNTVIGQTTAVYARALLSAYELLEDIYYANHKGSATGVDLDELAGNIGVARQKASNTSGTLALTGDNNTVVPSGAEFSQPSTKIKFALTDAATISLADCSDTLIFIGNVVDSVDYSITVDGTTYTYTADSDTTRLEIATGLFNAFGADNGTKFLAAIENTEEIRLSGLTTLTEISVQISNLLSTHWVTSLGGIVCLTEGAVDAAAGSVSSIETPQAGLTSVTNPAALVIGRLVETDEELRIRMGSSVRIAGKCTEPAIEAALENLEGVVSAVVYSNRTSEYDYSFNPPRPPHSYEAVVVGGSEADIAKTIWEGQPAGIEPFGNQTAIHVDSKGIERGIKYSRPVPIYIHVIINYTLYSEETPPDDIDTAIAEAVTAYGAGLASGVDVIAKRFFGAIYAAAEGIEELEVLIASASSLSDPPSAYVSTKIAIGDVETSDFDVSRVTVNQTA